MFRFIQTLASIQNTGRILQSVKCLRMYNPSVLLQTFCKVSQNPVSRFYSSQAEIEINLAGSVSPGEIDQENEKEDNVLESNPDITIRLIKPSGNSVIFHCSLPSKETRDQLQNESNDNLPSYSVDSVEMKQMSGYFVYTDLFDSVSSAPYLYLYFQDMYDHTMQLLMDRGLDAKFQHELHDFCTSEEHKLYVDFLNHFKSFCDE